MKRILSLSLCFCLVLLLLTVLAGPGFAAERDSALSGNPLIVDHAGLLSDSERAALEQQALSVSNAHGCEVIILTVSSADGKSAQDYAEDYFVDQGYGFGPDRNGVILFLDMGERDWHIAAHGSAEQVFNYEETEFLVSKFREDLSSGYYAEAFSTYIDFTGKMLGVVDGSLPEDEADQLNEEFDVFVNGEKSKPNYVKRGIFSVILGAIGGFIPVSAQKSALKTVRKRRNAAGYAKEGSMVLNVNQDIYLYSNVTSHVIQPQRTQSSGGVHTIGSGHSTSHTHSSGTTFSGHGGKF